jgi:ubiquinone biosynthesis protein
MIKTLKIGIGLETMKRMRTSPREMGRWLRRTLEESGPTYIKIGQFVGNRPDIFGSEVSEEVSKLQNQASVVFKAKKPNGLKKMDQDPIATASIAQVHRGVLFDGRTVAVKIKKPNVDDQLNKELGDIRIAFDFSKMFMNEMSILNGWFDDFEKNVKDELDFMKEIENIKFFHEIYKNHKDVRVPRVVSEFSDKNHIVMEYVPSESIKKCKNPILISENLMNVFIEQILYHGIIHGDLHAGNLGVSDETIVIYDLGNVIRIPEFYQLAVRKILVACQNRNSKELLDAMTEMGMKIKDMRAAKNFAKQFFVYLDTLDPKSFNYTSEDIMVPIELDTITLTIIRTYSLVEGICKEIYPQFTYERIIQQNIELLTIEQLVNHISGILHQPR